MDETNQTNDETKMITEDTQGLPDSSAGDSSNSTPAESATDNAYFTSYEDVSVHETMLKDKPRTLAYKNFIDDNPELFKDKVVMDVGAGTGILSFFAAKAGAKKVYAVEASGLSHMCEKLANHNGFSKVIEVIHGRVEDISLSGDIKVDIIISEWMGFYLLHESMLDSVIFARDKWLKKDGVVAPSNAYIYIAPVDLSNHFKDKFKFWSDVYGFDYSPLVNDLKSSMFTQPYIEYIPHDPKTYISEQYVMAEFDLSTVTLQDVEEVQEKCTFDIEQTGKLHGFSCWFDVKFTGGSKDVILSTGPESEPTHWKQTIFFLPRSIDVSENELIGCRVEMKQSNGNKRHYNISIEMVDPEDDEEDEGAHQIPCDCGASRCAMIAAIMQKYEDDHPELPDDADIIDIT
ncbi:unnamed protein product [Owenia fusiformis]|uniref:type I protein arginine methyltransferase n=1 Tax=Owenia fusiformis TaxID=6347 RepID=A0A8J1TWY2_OWEFU|nr:unnamed protein product [Owenia fusiformis]